MLAPERACSYISAAVICTPRFVSIAHAFMPKPSYYRRIFRAYLLGGRSQLTFWHDNPAENPNAKCGELGEY